MQTAQMIEVVGHLTTDETKELAKLCLGELADNDTIEVITEIASGDIALTDELIANLENT